MTRRFFLSIIHRYAFKHMPMFLAFFSSGLFVLSVFCLCSVRFFFVFLSWGLQAWLMFCNVWVIFCFRGKTTLLDPADPKASNGNSSLCFGVSYGFYFRLFFKNKYLTNLWQLEMATTASALASSILYCSACMSPNVCLEKGELVCVANVLLCALLMCCQYMEKGELVCVANVLLCVLLMWCCVCC